MSPDMQSRSNGGVRGSACGHAAPISFLTPVAMLMSHDGGYTLNSAVYRRRFSPRSAWVPKAESPASAIGYLLTRIPLGVEWRMAAALDDNILASVIKAPEGGGRMRREGRLRTSSPGSGSCRIWARRVRVSRRFRLMHIDTSMFATTVRRAN